MPERKEKLRRRAIVRALRDADEAAAQARRPVDKAILRELLPFLERELLVRTFEGQSLSRCDRALLNIDTVAGLIPFAEYIHVVDGQIVSVRGYYDPRPLLDLPQVPTTSGTRREA